MKFLVCLVKYFLFTKNNSTESGETANLDAGQYRHRSPDAGAQDGPGHRVDPGSGATRGAHLGQSGPDSIVEVYPDCLVGDQGLAT